MCSGYYAGIQATTAAKQTDAYTGFDEKEIEAERERISKPMKVEKDIGPRRSSMLRNAGIVGTVGPAVRWDAFYLTCGQNS
jgi:hypothetical protein